MPRLLDLCCGVGGASMGYARAGFEVTGVDIDPQPGYPFEFIRGDALEYLGVFGPEYDVIHAGPPCQPYSGRVTSHSSPFVRTKGKDEPALIAPLHEQLVRTGKPWVMENVVAAKPHMPRGWFVLCGAMFNRPIRRHRVFASNVPLSVPGHPKCWGMAQRLAAQTGWDYRDLSVTGKGRGKGTSERWAYLLGIDWPATQHDLAEAIPPAYTQHLGRQLLRR